MIAWFICQYKRRPDAFDPTRYCAMDDFTSLILTDGGAWAETEVLGGRAIVKVRASSTTLDTLAATIDFRRLPKIKLDDSLSDLTAAQRNVIVQDLRDMGYTSVEIQAELGTDIRQKMLGDVLRFAAKRRLTPRYDAVTDTIPLDGPVQACRPLSSVDNEVV